MKQWMKYGVVALIFIGFIFLFIWLSAPPTEEELAEQEKIEQLEKEKQEEEKKKQEEQEKKELARRPIPINPQGTYLIHHLFKSYDKTKKMKPMQSPIASNLPKQSTNAFPNIYMLIGDGAYLTHDDADELIDFVEKGNVAFISVSELDYSLKSQLFWGDEVVSEYDECMDVNFSHDSLHMYQDYHIFYEYNWGETYSDYWNFWDVSNLKYDDYAVISYGEMCDEYDDSQHPVCVRIKIGEGQLFIHTEPVLFTNKLLMTDIKGLEYAERVFSHLPRGNVYWHTLSGRFSHHYLAKKGPEEGAEGSGQGDYGKRRTSPLQFILSHPSLYWALYLLLAGLFFYIIFQSKRRRKIVPAAEKRTNSSVEFTDTVSQMYFQERRHDKLIKHMEVVFMDFIRNKYYMASARPDDEFISTLSKKSGIGEKQIRQIFNQFEYARRNGGLNDDFLVKMHENIDNFYKNCN